MMTSNKIEGYFIQQNWRLFSFWAPRFSKISTLSRDGHIQAFAIRRLVGDDRLTVQKQVVPGGRLSPHWHAVRCSGVFLSLGRIPSFLQGETSEPATRLTYYYNQWYCNNQTVMVAILILDIVSTFGELLWLHIIYIAYFPNCNLQLDNFHSSPILPGIMAWAA